MTPPLCEGAAEKERWAPAHQGFDTPATLTLVVMCRPRVDARNYLERIRLQLEVMVGPAEISFGPLRFPDTFDRRSVHCVVVVLVEHETGSFIWAIARSHESVQALLIARKPVFV